ncbi:MAG: hypothetical protein H0V60_01280 [Actinobacteria bacterium]|nr:hypothetical protein [Actinomycetota bacterium]
MDEKDITRLMGWLRVATGTAFTLAPAKTSRMWVGRDVDSVYTRMAARGLGARDLALGIGLLTAMQRGASVRGWLEAGALSDGIDAFNSVVGMRRLSKFRMLLLATAGGYSAYLGSSLASDAD